jgi:hypothetical protein
MLLGILIVIVPYSGIPVANRSLIEVILGVCVLAFGISLRNRDVRNALSRIEESPSASAQESLEDVQETPYQ